MKPLNWCDKCKCERRGTLHHSGIYIPSCEHDSLDLQIWLCLKEIERHLDFLKRNSKIQTRRHSEE